MKNCCKLILLLASTNAMAGVSESLSAFYSSHGNGINITRGGAYDGQRSGHYTAGSITTRNPNTSLQPISLQAPGYRAGCGGIDMNFGSFSHIKSAELKRFLNSIIASGANYAFMIGLEAVCPMCKKTMDQLNKIAQELTQFNKGSCEMAATAMGGLLPKSQATHNVLCPQLGTGGMFSDDAAARQGCGAEGKSGEVYARARANPATANLLKQFLADKGNLAWLALKQRSYFGADFEDDALRELMMSFSGSIILQYADNDTRTFVHLPSLAADKELYQALLYGGSASIYGCDTKEAQGCLHPTKNKTLSIKEDKSFTGMVKKHLISIQEKIREDEGEFTAEELRLISTTKRIPLYKALNVQSTHSFVAEIIDLSQYAEIIAVDMLEEYLNEIIDTIALGLKQLHLESENVKTIQDELRNAKLRIQYRRDKTEQDNTMSMDFISKLMLIEKMTAGEFSADLMHLANWSARQGG